MAELGGTRIVVDTEAIAYSLEELYYPLIRVFEAPYVEGDCPVDEVLVSGLGANSWITFVDMDDVDYRRAEIRSNLVFIRSLEGNDYEIGKEYEVRIYRSDVSVDQ